jgi:hypothetical protein
VTLSSMSSLLFLLLLLLSPVSWRGCCRSCCHPRRRRFSRLDRPSCRNRLSRLNRLSRRHFSRHSYFIKGLAIRYLNLRTCGSERFDFRSWVRTSLHTLPSELSIRQYDQQVILRPTVSTGACETVIKQSKLLEYVIFKICTC